MGRNKIKHIIQARNEEMENNDYISVCRSFWQMGIRHTRLTQQRCATTKKILIQGLRLSLVTIMFSLNPLHSKISQNDLILSSDIELSIAELTQIKNKILDEKIVAPCWIYIEDKMYLIEKRETIVDENGSKEKDSVNQGHQKTNQGKVNKD